MFIIHHFTWETFKTGFYIHTHKLRLFMQVNFRLSVVKMVSQESVFPIISHDAAQPDNTPLADWLDGQHAVFISSGFLPIHLPMYEAVDELNPLRGIWKSYVCTFNNLSSNQSTIRTASTGQHPYSTCYKPCNLASALYLIVIRHSLIPSLSQYSLLLAWPVPWLALSSVLL